MSETKLRACPFCGGEAQRIDIDYGENSGGSCIECKRCWASSRVEFERKENFIAAWNHRTDTALVEALREALEALNSAVDAFWNDPERPSTAKMRGNTVAAIARAQIDARAALRGDEPTGADQ